MNWCILLPWHWGFSEGGPRESRAKIAGEKRRCERVPAALPVFVYGRVGGEPFSEQTVTDNISAHGGLLRLSAELGRAQTLLLTNLHTNEDLACRVARRAKTETGRNLIGVEFLRPAPRFWSIDSAR